MESLKCHRCNKELTTEMEVEYSREVTEFFCGHICAIDYYFYYMRSLPVDLEDKEFLNEHEIKIVDEKFMLVER
ncbi:hypothetical protein SMD22_01325 (plasmid) [Brevibacillus halotolerans]|nr:hypothetical protein SMD22_01325 [Brevibacillus halotolerans]